MRLGLLLVPLLVSGCHRPWLQSEAPAAGAPASYGADTAAGVWGAYPPPPPTGPPAAAPYQPAVHQPAVHQPAVHQPAVRQPAVPHPGTSSPVAAPSSLELGRQAATAAQQLEGHAYCWGGTGPDCFDCSGLTSAAWARVGVVLPRTSDAQREKLRRVHWAEVQPGDVLWRPGHVGLYVERGWAIHAPGEGKTVEYQPAQTYEVALRPY